MDISSEKAGKWWARFWWARGVIAAFTLISLIPNFADLSRIQLLRAFHILIIGWSDFSAWLGTILGKLPLIPDLSSEAVNALLFALSFCLPAAYGIYSQRLLIERWTTLVIERLAGLNTPLGRHYKRLFRVFPWLIAFIALTGVPLFLFEPDVYIGIYANGWRGAISFAYLALLVCSVLIFGIVLLPGFARALLLTFSFIATLEIAYIANTPLIGDLVDSYYCQHIELKDPDCLSR